jgi:hypothetical protein
MSSMSYLAPLACALCCLSGPGQAARPGSYLHHLAPGPDGAPRHHVEAYTPQPGDLVFFDDHNRKWEFLYKVCGSGPPFHSGIVFALPDGTPGLLESGPDDTLWVRLLDGVPRLQTFKGDIWVRKVRRPLTKEQSACLTEFALAQDGKRYALGRLLLQGTPVKCRGHLRCNVFGKTRLDRSAWLCSELVVAAGTAVGLFDPHVHHANAIYPRDIVVDNARYDIGGTFHPAARWTAWPDQVPESFTPR